MKILLCRLFSPVLILANFNPLGSLVFFFFDVALLLFEWCAEKFMPWDRNGVGRLERLSDPLEQGCEVSLHSNQMETSPEEQ